MPRSPSLAPLLAPRYRRMSSEEFLEDPSDDLHQSVEEVGEPGRQCVVSQSNHAHRDYLVPVEASGRFDSAVLPGIWLLENWLWERPAASVVEAAYGLR